MQPCKAVIIIHTKYRLTHTALDCQYQMLQVSRAQTSTLIISFSTDSRKVSSLIYLLLLFVPLDEGYLQMLLAR